MAELDYLGPAAVDDADLGTRGYVHSVGDDDIPTSTIDARISTDLSAYVSTDDLTSLTADMATKDDVKSGDSTAGIPGTDNLVPLTFKDTAGGVPTLDAAGRVSRGQINHDNTQRFPHGPWSPTDFGSPVSVHPEDASHGIEEVDEAVIYTTDITDPGTPYRLAVFCTTLGLSGQDGAVAPLVRVRVGSKTGPVIAQGVGSYEGYDYLGIDHFNRVGGNLGSGWQESWTGPGTGHAVTDGSNCVYTKDGVSKGRIGLFIRTGNDATTPTDIQEITWLTASACEPGNDPNNPASADAQNLVLGRCSSDAKTFCGFVVGAGAAGLYYSANGTASNYLATVSGLPNAAGVKWAARFGTATNTRQFQLLCNDTVVLDYTDAAAATQIGSNYRHWGFGYESGQVQFGGFPTGQTAPAALNWITINDRLPSDRQISYSPVDVMPKALGSQDVLTGPQTLYVTVASTTAQTVVSAGYVDEASFSAIALAA